METHLATVPPFVSINNQAKFTFYQNFEGFKPSKPSPSASEQQWFSWHLDGVMVKSTENGFENEQRVMVSIVPDNPPRWAMDPRMPVNRFLVLKFKAYELANPFDPASRQELNWEVLFHDWGALVQNGSGFVAKWGWKKHHNTKIERKKKYSK